MSAVFRREMSLNWKNLFIWSFSVGLMGLICILLYKSMEGDMKEMADAFSNMGAFSDAFGMSTLNIATLKGYFATEVGTVHGLGGGMFAAILAIDILSKEEEKHTGEFLFSLPISRARIVLAKGFCVLLMLFFFTAICACFYLAGFVYLGEELPGKEFLIFMSRQYLMNLEIASICFAISALSGKSRIGIGLGVTLLCYAYDLLGRVVPDLKEYLFLGPYSYANASEIFTGVKLEGKAVWMAAFVMTMGIGFAFFRMNRRDLSS